MNFQLNMDIKYEDEVFPQNVTQVPPVTSISNHIPYESNNDGTSSNDGKEELLKKEFELESTEKKITTKLKKRKLKSNNVKSIETCFSTNNQRQDCPQHTEEPVKDERKGILGNIQEDSSWYDLTDTSLTSIILNPLGSGDAVGRAKLHVFKDDAKKFERKVEPSNVLILKLSKSHRNICLFRCYQSSNKHGL